MTTEYSYQQFEAYTAGQMTPDQQRQFEARLAGDAELRQAFEDFQISQKALELLVYRDTRRRVEASLATNRQAKVVTLNPGRRWMKRAAGIAAIAVASLGYSNLEYSDRALVRANLESPESFVQRTATRSTGQQALVSAADALEQGQLDEVTRLLEDLDLSGVEANNAAEMRGYALLRLNQPREALAAFEEVSSDLSDETRKEVVEWEIVLATLRSGDEEKAAALLDAIIAQPDHDYYSEATKLKRKLGSVWRKLVL